MPSLASYNGCLELDECFFVLFFSFVLYIRYLESDFFHASYGFLIPFTRANAQWVIHGMGLIGTLVYTSELILCSTICVLSATRHNMYPYFLLAAIHHLKSSPTFSVRLRSSVGRVTVDLIRRSWVRFLPGSFFFFLCLVWFPDFLY